MLNTWAPISIPKKGVYRRRYTTRTHRNPYASLRYGTVSLHCDDCLVVKLVQRILEASYAGASGATTWKKKS